MTGVPQMVGKWSVSRLAHTGGGRLTPNRESG
jgi:hypothetical protein